MTEAQPEARKNGDLYLKVLMEGADWVYALVHAPGCILHQQMTFVSRKQWDTFERVG